MFRPALVWIPLLSLSSMRAQTSTLLYSIRDCPVGYHDNYNTENTNYNSAVHFSAFSQPGASGGVNNGRGLIEFDLSSIPADSTILGAFLSLSAHGPWATTGTVATVGHVGDNDCVLRRITSSWNENTVTWNTQPTTTIQNEVAVPQSTYAMQNYLNIDVTSLVRDMVEFPAQSHGFMFSLVNEAPSRGLVFYTGLAGEMDKRPVLLVVYGDCASHVGMSEPNPAAFGLEIFPSIAAVGTVVQINTSLPPLQGTTLTLIDATGKLVANMTVDRWPYSLVVPVVAPGVYALSVEQKDQANAAIGRLVVR